MQLHHLSAIFGGDISSKDPYHGTPPVLCYGLDYLQHSLCIFPGGAYVVVL